MKIGFNEKEYIKKTQKYAEDCFKASQKPKRDFFNFLTMKVHCGKCARILSPTRAIFHVFCKRKELDNN